MSSIGNDNDYYNNYRKGVINRHICANGRFLQLVWLVEKDRDINILNPTEDEILIKIRNDFEETKRKSIESIQDGLHEGDVEYCAFPLVLKETNKNLRGLNVEMTNNNLVIGGGDNPFLQGGLALAFFAMESYLDISPNNSYDYAIKLFDYFEDSEIQGCMFRRRSWYYEQKKSPKFATHTRLISKDEFCGILLGIFFLYKSATKKNDKKLKKRLQNFANRIGTYLEINDWLVEDGAWFIFKYPFCKILNYITGKDFDTGPTIPLHALSKLTKMQELGILDPIATLLVDCIMEIVDALKSAKNLAVDFFTGNWDDLADDWNDLLDGYASWNLYEDLLNWTTKIDESSWGDLIDYVVPGPDVFGFLLEEMNINKRIAKIQVFNFTMIYHTLLMLLVTAENDKSANSLFELRDVIKKFMKYVGGNNPQNCYFEVISKYYDSFILNKRSRPCQTLLKPQTWFYHSLPITLIYDPEADPNPEKFKDEVNPLSHGNFFTWEDSDEEGHYFRDWGRDMGPDYYDSIKNDSTKIKDQIAQIKNMLSSDYYSARVDKPLRCEASGLDYLYPRLLMVYLNPTLKKPSLTPDIAFSVLPLNGPYSELGLIANPKTMEIHSLWLKGSNCQISEIKNRVKYISYKKAIEEGYDSCYYCIHIGSKH